MDEPKLSDPGTGSPPPPPATPYPQLELTSDDKLWAMLAHIGGGLFGFWPPLIVYLIYKDKSKFIAFHALQALFLQLLAMALHLAVALPTCGMGVGVTVPLALIYAIVIGVKANHGEWAEYVIVAGWARKSVLG